MMDIIEILNTHKFTVLWSGGKDSTAALLWTIDNVNHEDWNILYVEVTGNTSPLCNRYVHETAETLKVSDRLMHVKSENDFFDLIKKNGVPTPTSRWCLRLMKLEPMKKYSHHIQVTGMKLSIPSIWDFSLKQLKKHSTTSSIVSALSIPSIWDFSLKHGESVSPELAEELFQFPLYGIFL